MTEPMITAAFETLAFAFYIAIMVRLIQFKSWVLAGFFIAPLINQYVDSIFAIMGAIHE